uniref:Uncharacterized protein n=1 Tax=Trichogramma kaykai TaxID=54128 RepID=A0ABD2WI25_9HYME
MEFGSKRLKLTCEMTTELHPCYFSCTTGLCVFTGPSSVVSSIAYPYNLHEVEDNSSRAAARYEHVLSHTDAARSPPPQSTAVILAIDGPRACIRAIGEYMQSCVWSWYGSCILYHCCLTAYLLIIYAASLMLLRISVSTNCKTERIASLKHARALLAKCVRCTSLEACRTCTAYAEGGSTRFIAAADALSVCMRANCSSMPSV